MKKVLANLERFDMHVHEIREGDFRNRHLTTRETHYVMKDADIVFIGSINCIINFSLRLGKELKGWHIKKDPKPIPTRSFDYDFWHDNHDGDNGLCGNAKSVEDAIQQINELEE